MGMPLLDGPRLNDLAETAARLNQWEFLLVIAPPSVLSIEFIEDSATGVDRS